MLLDAFNEAYRAAEHEVRAAFDAGDDGQLTIAMNHLKCRFQHNLRV